MDHRNDATSYINKALQGDRLKAMQIALDDALPEIKAAARNKARLYRVYFVAFRNEGFTREESLELSAMEIENTCGNT